MVTGRDADRVRSGERCALYGRRSERRALAPRAPAGRGPPLDRRGPVVAGRRTHRRRERTGWWRTPVRSERRRIERPRPGGRLWASRCRLVARWVTARVRGLVVAGPERPDLDLADGRLRSGRDWESRRIVPLHVQMRPHVVARRFPGRV